MSGAGCVLFVPSRVEGLDGVHEVCVSADRLEIATETGTRTIQFANIARWPWPALLWKALFRCGIRPKWLPVADRDWFHRPPDRFFRFYTDPPLVICMPADEVTGPYAQTTFVRVRESIHSGGFHTFDLG